MRRVSRAKKKKEAMVLSWQKSQKVWTRKEKVMANQIVFVVAI